MLEAHLKEIGVSIEFGRQLIHLDVRNGTVVATVGGPDGPEEIYAQHVFGADGSHSTTRKYLETGFQGAAKPEQWSLADLEGKVSLKYDLACIELSDNYLIFVMKMSDGIYRVACNRRGILKLIPDWLEVKNVLWESDFDVHHKVAERFSVGNIYIGGDAAHVHSPLGGRGMNLGSAAVVQKKRS